VEEIRVGLVGAGALGAIHVASLATIPGCRLAVVASEALSAQVATAAAAANARLVEPDAVFDNDLVDVVLIATPTDTHAVYACRALEAGQSVFCEKPLARTLQEAERIRDLAETLDGKVAVGHVVRYFPEYVAARDLARSGKIGAAQTARLSRHNTGPAAVAGWYAEADRSGGVLLDMAIHDVDWCLWAFGPADRVFAVRSGAGGREIASITIRHRQGTISYIDASWRNATFATYLEVSGTQGVYRTSGSGLAGFEFDHRGGATQSYLPAADIATDNPYVLELRAAFEWFGGGERPRATAVEACEAVRVVAAAEQSILSNAAVAVVAGGDA
jgi:UDP-N-acetylglucosamine 3-dehydrogenase